MMFGELDFLDRFAAARKAGFEAVEFLFPYDFPVSTVAEAISANDLQISVFNLSPGDWAAGDRGLAAVPGREADFRASVERALTYAKAIGAKRLHVMAGVVEAAASERARATYVDNLKYAADRLGAVGINALIEPINSRDMPGYFLADPDAAAKLIEDIGSSNLRLQFDVYHQQIIRGDVSVYLERLMPLIGHVQIAGVPDRHEPDEGEVNYAHVFGLLDRLGYAGWVGCEYRPRGKTVDGLDWMRNKPGN